MTLFEILRWYFFLGMVIAGLLMWFRGGWDTFLKEMREAIDNSFVSDTLIMVVTLLFIVVLWLPIGLVTLVAWVKYGVGYVWWHYIDYFWFYYVLLYWRVFRRRANRFFRRNY